MVLQLMWTATCRETEAALSDRLDGEIGGIRAFRVTRHLLRCEDCRRVLHSLRRAVEQLRTLRRPDPSSPSIAGAVVARLRGDQATAAAR